MATDQKNTFLSQTFLTEEQVKQLEEWTNRKCEEVVFDSDIHDWKVNTSVCVDKATIPYYSIYVIEETGGEIFGFYLDDNIQEYFREDIWCGNKAFHFNLVSNGRLPGPMKFEIKDESWGYYLNRESDERIMRIGQISLKKEEHKEDCCFSQDNKAFDYHGIERALCDKEPNARGFMFFTPKRFQIIQMSRHEINPDL